MLTHGHAFPAVPQRVVVMGAGGFVGGAIVMALEARGMPCEALTRGEVDLLATGAGERLAARLRPTDAFIAVSAVAPVKNAAMLRDNIAIAAAMAAAFQTQPVAHVVNIGSDAVYADSRMPLTEGSCTGATSLHGVMHLARELILKEGSSGVPFASLRPTLIYGADDPHNGYGPNRFRRLAAEGGEIVLFGEGEERRDHVYIGDVAELAVRILLHRSEGILNAATGKVISFRECAELVTSLFPEPVPVRGSPRRGPMPHGGYRAFDPAATYKAFPDFRYTLPAEGFARVHALTTEVV